MNKNIPGAVLSLSRERAPKFYKLSKENRPKAIEIGQIWSTYSQLSLPDLPESSTDEPRLIVILEGAGIPSDKLDQITALPISIHITMATDYDLIIREPESTLGYEFMVEVWNEIPVLKAHLRNHLGQISNEAISILQGIHAARLLNEEVSQQWRAWIGLPILSENDLRTQFQNAEIEAVDYLSNIAIAALLEGIANPTTVTAEEATKTRKRRFELVPKFGSVADFLRTPKVAYAASTPSGNEMVVAQNEGENSFIFEIVVSRRESLVYLIVHTISPVLEGLECVVTLQMPDTVFRSESAKLQKEAQIPVARISPSFDRRQIQKVIIEIED